MSESRSLPRGRLGRLARYAGLGAGLIRAKDPASAAARAADVLGTMRGLAAKIGQMMSYVDGMVPGEHGEAYQAALRALQTAAPSSSPEAIRRLIEEDLGAPMDRLFESFEDEPFASASIGQVHRATLKDGRRVAVKVQHPGVAEAVESDLANAGVFQGMVSAFGPRNINPREVFAEIKQRFREELDYTLEAERQRFFIELHAGDPDIHIPDVIAERSSRRVLTTVLAAGMDLEKAAGAPEEVRRRHARVLWRFVFKGNLVGGMFNADPHPGNYLFAEDGAVTFLDFGCCQPLAGERLEHGLSMHRAALLADEAAFQLASKRMLRTRGGTFEAKATAYTRACFEPLFASPFKVEPFYVKGLVQNIMELKQEVFAKDKSFTPLPPGMLFMNRLQFGFYSVLSRLGVEADYAAEERAFLAAAGLL